MSQPQLRTVSAHDYSRLPFPRQHENGGNCCSHANGLCDKCKRHFGISVEAPRTLEATYEPPDPYAPHLAEIRAASSTPMSKFEDQYKAQREAEFAQERAERERYAAERPAVRTLSAADLKQYEPPDPYAAELKALKETK